MCWDLRNRNFSYRWWPNRSLIDHIPHNIYYKKKYHNLWMINTTRPGQASIKINNISLYVRVCIKQPFNNNYIIPQKFTYLLYSNTPYFDIFYLWGICSWTNNTISNFFFVRAVACMQQMAESGHIRSKHKPHMLIQPFAGQGNTKFNLIQVINRRI